MISNYFHDLAVAVLAVNVAVVYFLGKYLDEHPHRDELLSNLFGKLSRVTYGALVWIVIGGAIRAYYFKEFELHPAIENGFVAALIVKHIILFSLTAVGLVVHRNYVRKYGKQA